jgi:hypothetical protein
MDTQVAELLGGEGVLGASVKSNLDLARATREGLPTEAAIQLAALILDCVPEGPLGPLMPYGSSAGEIMGLVNGHMGLPRRRRFELRHPTAQVSTAVAAPCARLPDP